MQMRGRAHTAWLSAMSLHAQVVAHQCQRQGQAPHLLDEVTHLLRLRLDHAGSQQTQQVQTLLLVECSYHHVALGSKRQSHVR